MLTGLRPQHVILIAVPVVILTAVFLLVFRRDVFFIPVFAPWGSSAEANAAEICFSQLRVSGPSLSVFVKSSTCASSSCTERYGTFGDAWVNDLTRSIHFNSKFVYGRARDPNLLCTADCAGAGHITVFVGPITPGKYSVWLGTTWVGEIEVRVDGRETGGGCLSPSTPGARLPDLNVPIPSQTTPAYPVPTEPLGFAPGYP